MTTKTRSTILQTLIFAILGIALIVWRYNAMSESDKDAMFQAFGNVRWVWAIPIFIASFFSHYFRALRWKQLLSPLSIVPKTSNVVYSVLIGYLANVAVPRMGEIAKCTVLAKYEKVPADKLIGTIIAERAFDVVCFGVLLLLTLMAQYPIIAPYAQQVFSYLFKDELGNFLWMRILLLAILGIVGLVGMVVFYKKTKGTKIGQILNGILAGLIAIKNVKNKTAFLLNTILIWGLYTSIAIMVLYAMPETSHLSPLVGLSVITFGSIAMMVPAPGSIAYPVIVAPVLVLYGLSEPIGQAYGWINWAAQNATVISFGIAALILLPLSNRTKNELN